MFRINRYPFICELIAALLPVRIREEKVGKPLQIIRACKLDDDLSLPLTFGNGYARIPGIREYLAHVLSKRR